MIKDASSATKMSWVSERQTSRVEDIAYCLMGLFDVNMPLLYGEGSKAFMRLQLEIIKKSDDDSIFAWTLSKSHQDYSGLLASSPLDFVASGNVMQGESSSEYAAELPWMMTNVGLELHVLSLNYVGLAGGRRQRIIAERLNTGVEDMLELPLNCFTLRDGGEFALLISLVRIRSIRYRILTDHLEFIDYKTLRIRRTQESQRKIYVRQPDL